MVINRFKTRIPFYNSLGKMQSERMVCANCYGASLQPRDIYPEIVLEYPATQGAPTQVVVTNEAGGIVATITTAALLAARYFNYSDSGGAKRIVMIPASDGAEFTCGRRYRYRVTVGGIHLWYSDLWEATGDTERQMVQSARWTVLEYSADCNTGGIPYSIFDNNTDADRFWNHIYIDGEKLNPETEVKVENQEDNQGRIVSSVQTIWKRYAFNSPLTPDYVLDALGTLSMYAQGESVYLKTNIIGGDDPVLCGDVSVEKPEYRTNECTPTVRCTVAIDARLFENGCCGSVSDDTSLDNECYSDFTPPTLNGSNVTDIPGVSTGFRVTLGNTTGGSSTQIPTFSLVQIEYKAFGSPGAFGVVGVYNHVQMAAGVDVSTVAGSFTVRIAVLGDASGNCQSPYSNEYKVTVT